MNRFEVNSKSPGFDMFHIEETGTFMTIDLGQEAQLNDIIVLNQFAEYRVVGWEVSTRTRQLMAYRVEPIPVIGTISATNYSQEE